MTELPDNWKEEPFSQVAQYSTGRTPARANEIYWKNGTGSVPWVAISDMEQYGEIIDTAEKVSETAFHKVFHGRFVPAGTLLMSFKLTIGRVATLAIPACHNEAIISIYPRKDIDQRYLAYYLSQVDYSDHQDRQVKGNTLNQSKIDRIPVLLPPSDEQSQIADILDLCREAINTEHNAEKISTELKQSAMRELFTKGLRGEAQKETDIGPVPESWDLTRLDDVTTLERGRFMHRPRNEPRFYEGNTPFIQTGDVVRSAGYIRKYSQSLNDQGVAISRVFRAGTILITIAANIGYSGVLAFDAACPDSLVAISPSEKLTNLFLNYYLQTQQLQMDQAAPKGTQKNINIQFLSPWPVLVPKLDEQHEIVAILSALDLKIDLHRQKRAVLEQLFQSLLHKLMTGEIRVSELDLSTLAKGEAA